ncbi:hypothetical protein CapIbe_018351 [Capra ibex]
MSVVRRSAVLPGLAESAEDCPLDAEDFRAQQCSAYNDVQYQGCCYEWLPQDNDPAAPCTLRCQAQGETLSWMGLGALLTPWNVYQWHLPETFWELGNWTHCSDMCSHLEARIQRSQCLMANGQEVSEAFCDQLWKPWAAFHPCNIRDCLPSPRCLQSLFSPCYQHFTYFKMHASAIELPYGKGPDSGLPLSWRTKTLQFPNAILEELLPEVNSMKVLNHPNAVKLLKVPDTEERRSSLWKASVGETCTPAWMSRAA